MGLAIRIDIDNPFGYATRFRRVLNRLSINYGIVPKLHQLGYLDNSVKLSERLTNGGIPATWFFRTVSTPTRGLLHNFTNASQDLGLHAEQTGGIDSFSREVEHWQKRCGTKPKGFTKHGSGELKLSRKHDPTYAPKQLLEYGKKLGLGYFLGNGHTYQESFSEHDGIIFAPSVFWLDRTTLYGDTFSLESVIEESSMRPIIMLVHPVWFNQRRDVAESLEQMIDKCEFSSIEDILHQGLKSGSS